MREMICEPYLLTTSNEMCLHDSLIKQIAPKKTIFTRPKDLLPEPEVMVGKITNFFYENSKIYVWSIVVLQEISPVDSFLRSPSTSRTNIHLWMINFHKIVE
jgi:hypothetical protein